MVTRVAMVAEVAEVAKAVQVAPGAQASRVCMVVRTVPCCFGRFRGVAELSVVLRGVSRCPVALHSVRDRSVVLLAVP